MIRSLRLTTGLGMLLLAGATAVPAATITFSDSTFDPDDYIATPIGATGPGVAVSVVQCPACGNPGSAVAFGISMPTTADVQGRVGILNTMFAYDPSVSGALLSVDTSVDKDLLVEVDDLGGFTGAFGNTYRPMISQGGLYYLAALVGPPLPNSGGTSFSGSTGYNTIGATGLLATSFLQYDFATGLFGTANPDFSGSSMLFGIAQISTAGAPLSGVDVASRYDNLRFTLHAVPEPSTLGLLVAGLLMMLGVVRRPLTARP